MMVFAHSLSFPGLPFQYSNQHPPAVAPGAYYSPAAWYLCVRQNLDYIDSRRGKCLVVAQSLMSFISFHGLQPHVQVQIACEEVRCGQAFCYCSSKRLQPKFGYPLKKGGGGRTNIKNQPLVFSMKRGTSTFISLLASFKSEKTLSDLKKRQQVNKGANTVFISQNKTQIQSVPVSPWNNWGSICYDSWVAWI